MLKAPASGADPVAPTVGTLGQTTGHIARYPFNTDVAYISSLDVSHKGKKEWAETGPKPRVNLKNKGAVITNFVIETAQTLEANGHKNGRKYIKIRAAAYFCVDWFVYALNGCFCLKGVFDINRT